MSDFDFNWLTSCLRSCKSNENDKTHGFPLSCGMAIGTKNDIFDPNSADDNMQFIIKSYNGIICNTSIQSGYVNDIQYVSCKVESGEIKLNIRLYCLMKDGKYVSVKSYDTMYDGGDIELYINKTCLPPDSDKIRITHYVEELDKEVLAFEISMENFLNCGIIKDITDITNKIEAEINDIQKELRELESVEENKRIISDLNSKLSLKQNKKQEIINNTGNFYVIKYFKYKNSADYYDTWLGTYFTPLNVTRYYGVKFLNNESTSDISHMLEEILMNDIKYVYVSHTSKDVGIIHDTLDPFSNNDIKKGKYAFMNQGAILVKQTKKNIETRTTT